MPKKGGLPGGKKPLSHMHTLWFTPKECEAWLDKPYVNPRTGRLIVQHGPTYNKFVQSCRNLNIDVSGVTGCKNDSDPIGQAPWGEDEDVPYSMIVRLNDGTCHNAEDIFELHRRNVLAGPGAKPAKNPMTRADLTNAEIKRAIRTLRENGVEYEEPVYAPIGPPDGIELIIEPYQGVPGLMIIKTRNVDAATQIMMLNMQAFYNGDRHAAEDGSYGPYGRMRDADIIIGTMPIGWNERGPGAGTGSAWYDSDVLQVLLHTLWDNRKIVVRDVDQMTGIDELDNTHPDNYGGDPRAIWRDEVTGQFRIDKFRELMDALNEL